MTGRRVRVVYTKYDGSLHWHHPMGRLGEDEHGVWLGANAGTRTRRGREPAVLLDSPFVQLFPHGQWWTATFNGEPARTDIYCDVGTPPHWVSPGEVTMADLDLDVLRLRAERQVLLVDEDEFAEHQVRYGDPAEVVRAAEAAAAWLFQAVSTPTEPFATRYLDWLDLVGAAGEDGGPDSPEAGGRSIFNSARQPPTVEE